MRHDAYLLFGKVLGILLAEKLYFKRWFLRNLEPKVMFTSLLKEGTLP